VKEPDLKAEKREREIEQREIDEKYDKG